MQLRSLYCLTSYCVLSRSTVLKRVKNKYAHMKSKFKLWEEYYDAVSPRSGWTVNEAGLPVSSPEVMEAHFVQHPSHRQFSMAKPEYCMHFEELLAGNTATGEFAGLPYEICASTEGEDDVNDVDDVEDREEVAVKAMEGVEDIEDVEITASTRTTTPASSSIRARMRSMSSTPSSVGRECVSGRRRRPY